MENESGKWGIALLVGIGIGVAAGSSFGPSRGEYEAALGQCDSVRDDYVAALEDAQSSIEEANSQLADGQSYAWSSYDDMGYALENLYEVEETDDPGTSCF